MPNVYPESLKPVEGSFRDRIAQMEAYMRYMCERSDFAISNLERRVEALEKRVAALEAEQE